MTYFIQQGDDGPVKIGIANNPAQRLERLQCGNPEPLYGRVLIPGNHERELHKRYAEKKIRGEWFDASVLLDLP